MPRRTGRRPDHTPQHLLLPTGWIWSGRESRRPADGKEVILGVRPEHIIVNPQPREGAVESEVYVLEPHSNELVLDLKLGEQVLKAREDKDDLGFRPRVGQRVWMECRQKAVHLFDPETQKRLT